MHEDRLLHSPNRTQILAEAAKALSVRPYVALAPMRVPPSKGTEDGSRHAKERRSTSKGVLLERVEMEFFEACRDGDIKTVERLTTTDPLVKEPAPHKGGPIEKLRLMVCRKDSASGLW